MGNSSSTQGVEPTSRRNVHMSPTSRKCPDLQRVRQKHGEEKGIIKKLQRTIGNHAVQRLLHAKAVGIKAGRGAASGYFALDARHNLESRVQRARGSGQPLSRSERDIFEPRFGYGLRQDKIHTDANATPLNRETKARVITIGKDKLPHITKNWRGRPLTSHEVVVNLIANTTTDVDLTIEASLDSNEYPTGIRVSDKEIKAINLVKDDFHGEWNYSIAPSINR